MRKVIIIVAVTLFIIVLIIVSLILLNVSHDSNIDGDIEREWIKYKQKFNKYYNSSVEDEYRKQIYITSKNLITEHNKLYDKGLVTFTLGINHFADLTDKEYVGSAVYGDGEYNLQNNLDNNDNNESEETLVYGNFTKSQLFLANNTIEYKSVYRNDLPLEVDWIKYGYNNPILDQGNCGSCYIFASLAAIEANYYIKYKTLLQLSHQEILNCGYLFGSAGCNGGFSSLVMEYIMLRGIGLSYQNPYKGKEMLECKQTKPRIYIKKNITKKDCNELILKEIIALYGPVASSLNAELYTFKFYKSGLYYDPKCLSDNLGHDVTTVGYGVNENGKEYWLIRNSFGQDWGINGYMHIARNRDNHCGLATEFNLPQF